MLPIVQRGTPWLVSTFLGRAINYALRLELVLPEARVPTVMVKVAASFALIILPLRLMSRIATSLGTARELS